MTEFNETDAQSPKEKKLLNLCKALAVADNIKFEATKPIRKWLVENGDLFPAAKDLRAIGEQLEDNQSKPKIDELVYCCHKLLKNSVRYKLEEKKGFETVRKAI